MKFLRGLPTAQVVFRVLAPRAARVALLALLTLGCPRRDSGRGHGAAEADLDAYFGLTDHLKEIPDRQTCSECVVKVTPLGPIGGPDDSASFPITSSTIAPIADNGYLVAPTGTPGELAVYDIDGRLTRTIHRRGGGPGEFRDIRCVFALRADSVGVLDLAKIVILSPSFDFVREEPLPPGVSAFRAVGLQDGSVVLNDNVSGGPGLVLLDPDLKMVRGFGPGSTSPVGNPRALKPLMTADPPNGRFVTVRQDQYEIYQWDMTTGGLSGAWRPQTRWFVPWNHTGPELFSKPGSALLDVQNRLWVIDWILKIKPPEPSMSPGREQGYDPQALSQMGTPYRSRLEVFDLARSSLLVATDVCSGMCWLLADGLLVESTRDDGVRFTALRVELADGR